MHKDLGYLGDSHHISPSLLFRSKDQKQTQDLGVEAWLKPAFVIFLVIRLLAEVTV